MAPGPGQQNQVFNIPMRPAESSSLYLGMSSYRYSNLKRFKLQNTTVTSIFDERIC
jgi:hypothetical protein